MGADFADQVAIAVADVWVQISDQTDGIEDVVFADFAVDRNAFDAFVGQVDRGIAQEGNGFKHTLGDYRLHNVQLQLTCFGCESDGGVVADDFEADLVDDLRNHRIDFGRHDGRTGLQFRQVDFFQTGARTGREQAQVVTDFG